VSPAGDRVYLTTFGGDALSIWSLEGDVVRPLDWSGIPRKDVTSLAVSPDGGLLALGGREGVVVLVDTVRETVKTRLTPPSQEDEGDVRSLAFSPLGDELAVGTQRGTIRLWKVGDIFTPLVRLPGHRGTVSNLAYDAGARRLASGSQDKTVVVWDLKLVRDELAKLGLDWSSPGSYKP
jgi:WD40 repeat protein